MGLLLIRIRELYQIGVSPKFESCFLKLRRDQVWINSFVKGSSIPKEATSSGFRLPCKRSSMLWVLSLLFSFALFVSLDLKSPCRGVVNYVFIIYYLFHPQSTGHKIYRRRSEFLSTFIFTKPSRWSCTGNCIAFLNWNTSHFLSTSDICVDKTDNTAKAQDYTWN